MKYFDYSLQAGSFWAHKDGTCTFPLPNCSHECYDNEKPWLLFQQPDFDACSSVTRGLSTPQSRVSF